MPDGLDACDYLRHDRDERDHHRRDDRRLKGTAEHVHHECAERKFPVDGVVQIEVVRDEVVLASATAVPDVFGYWETSLTPSASAEPGEVQLRLSTGTDDNYRETTFSATLGS